MLKVATFQHYIDHFNKDDNEIHEQYIPNAQAWSFLAENILLFECPDPDIELTYYFR